jgi:hypothetical protein
MFYIVFLLLLSATSSSVGATLQCYSTSLHELNYTVTSATLPSYNVNKVTSDKACEIEVRWHKDPLSSAIKFSAANTLLIGDFVGDQFRADVQLSDYRGDSIIRVYRSMTYKCNSSDLCNDQTTLKRLLDSLLLEESYPREFYSLINITSTFDNNTAATCLRFSNVTSECTMPNFESCQSCTTDVYRSPSGSESICATCPERTIGNAVNSESIFLLNNRTQIYDRKNIECQRERCNSMENIDKIRQSTTITFDFEKFFRPSPNDATSLRTSALFMALFMTFQFLNIC